MCQTLDVFEMNWSIFQTSNVKPHSQSTQHPFCPSHEQANYDQMVGVPEVMELVEHVEEQEQEQEEEREPVDEQAGQEQKQAWGQEQGQGRGQEHDEDDIPLAQEQEQEESVV